MPQSSATSPKRAPLRVTPCNAVHARPDAVDQDGRPLAALVVPGEVAHLGQGQVGGQLRRVAGAVLAGVVQLGRLFALQDDVIIAVIGVPLRRMIGQAGERRGDVGHGAGPRRGRAERERV